MLCRKVKKEKLKPTKTASHVRKNGEHYDFFSHGDSNDLARFINTNFLSGI